jgi:transketolase
MSHDAATAGLFDCRRSFSEELLALARADERIVVVCNDSVGSSNLPVFQKEFPDRLINVGIAEQDMVGVAAGLANGGLIPFVSAASPFLTARAMEQIKADIAYSHHHVILCGQSPGMSYGQLGPTHHSIEDIGWLRVMGDITVVIPADPQETRDALRWAVAHDGPVFLRIGRTAVPAVTPEGIHFTPGRAVSLREGKDVTIIACGVTVAQALGAAAQLADDGISARVLNMASIVPLDEDSVLRAAAETGRIVTVEEASCRGGLGGAVAELVVRHRPVPMRILGVPHFAPTGTPEFLLKHFGLTSDGIVDAVRELMRQTT